MPIQDVSYWLAFSRVALTMPSAVGGKTTAENRNTRVALHVHNGCPVKNIFLATWVSEETSTRVFSRYSDN